MFKSKNDTRSVSFMALFIAMEIVLEYVCKLIPAMPQGGGVSFAYVPILLAAYLMGPGAGVIVGLGAAALQFALGLASYWGPWSVILDYVLPLAVLGLAPFVPNVSLSKRDIHIGIGVLFVVKYFIHVVSGGWLFASYAPTGMNPWMYSLAYNLPYNLASMVATWIIFELIWPRLSATSYFRH